jgi:hypothetical protein
VSKKFVDAIDVKLERTSPTSVAFTPSLLNAGEWIEFQFVTDGPIEIPKVHLRIAGHDGQPGDVAARQEKFWLPISVGSLIATMLVPIVATSLLPKDSGSLPLLIAVSLLVLTFFAAGQTGKTSAWAVDEATRLRKQSRNRKKN